MQNPLESYRRTQRELRRHFDAFTRANCPTCPTPCCRRPARILPTDILLAEATGWKANLPTTEESASPRHPTPDTQHPLPDMVAEIAGRMAEALGNPPGEETEAGSLPCEYLGEQGCSFPTDLRPFGCTAFVCKYMYAQLSRQELSRIKRLIREMEERHRELLRNLRPMS